MKSGLEIAQEAVLRPIEDVASDAGILDDELERYGRHKAKVSLSILDRLADRPDGRLIITTAITPTKAGEGKTTTSISLTQGMGRIGRDVMLCLREPSMGPVFGIKGGGNGGGYAQVVPMEEINLHFNGDFHAVQAAHNLLAAALDASIYHGNLGIDPVSVTWPRTLDVNDRELRYSVVGLGGKAHGVPRENQFVIVAASEIMAVLALATDLADLRTRIGRIVVDGGRRAGDRGGPEGRRGDGRDHEGRDQAEPRADARGPAHADPCGTVREHRAREQLDHRGSDRAEARRLRGDGGGVRVRPRVPEVLRHRLPVRRVRAVRRRPRHHGPSHEVARGTPFDELAVEDVDALERGIDNLAAHIGIVREYGLPCVVSINNFPTDTEKEIDAIRELAGGAGAETVVVNRAFTDGGAGAAELAEAVVQACERPSTFHLLTPEGTPLKQQIEAIATKIYGADGVDYQPQGEKDITRMEQLGFGTMPVCMAKTHLSLSHDPTLLNRPTGFRLPVRGVVPSAGAGFVVVLCGDMQRMPGLGRTPAFRNVDLDPDGRTVGLF